MDLSPEDMDLLLSALNSLKTDVTKRLRDYLSNVTTLGDQAIEKLKQAVAITERSTEVAQFITELRRSQRTAVLAYKTGS